MRITGGEAGGRRYEPPAKIPARPTTDMAREGLFNILSNKIDFDKIRFLDLFAGTGSVSYEVASRAVRSQIVAVEKDQASASFIKKTSTEMGFAIDVVRIDAFRYLETAAEQFDLIFADPPYALPQLAEIPSLVLSKTILKKGGLLVVEHDRRNSFKDHLHFQQERKYGDSIFSFLGE